MTIVTLMERRPELRKEKTIMGKPKTFDQVMAERDAKKHAALTSEDEINDMVNKFLNLVWLGKIHVPPRTRKPAGAW